MIRMLMACALIWAAASTTSCIAVAGGTTESKVRATAGQELIDLKAALDKGVITQAEYDKKKNQILAER